MHFLTSEHSFFKNKNVLIYVLLEHEPFGLFLTKVVLLQKKTHFLLGKMEQVIIFIKTGLKSSSSACFSFHLKMHLNKTEHHTTSSAAQQVRGIAL